MTGLSTQPFPSKDQPVCSSCGHVIMRLPDQKSALPHITYDGVFCEKCNHVFCRLCLEFFFVNSARGSNHVSCGGSPKLIRVQAT